jgi:hypothetical protein
VQLYAASHQSSAAGMGSNAFGAHWVLTTMKRQASADASFELERAGSKAVRATLSQDRMIRAAANVRDTAQTACVD